MAREVELTTLQPAILKVLGEEAERVLDEFYKAQLLKHQSERKHLEQSNQFRPGPSAKWNRQELYLDPASLSLARSASRQHLLRHPEWLLQGAQKLCAEELRDIAALQHFAWVDLEDLSLAPEERRSEDVFVGASGNVCEQLLLDATRAALWVDEEEFDFSKELRELRAGLQFGPEEDRRRQSEFCDRVVAAVESSLGEDPPAILTRVVSTAMSQSGLANVERACDRPQVAVSGGDQDLRYRMQRLAPDGPWDIELFVRKVGFDHCIICRPPAQSIGRKHHVDDNEDLVPVPCSPSSCITKSCRLRYRMVGPSREVQVDTLSLNREHRLLDRNGRPLLGFEPPRSGSILVMPRLLRMLGISAAHMCGRCLGGCAGICAGVRQRLRRPQ
ncbi:unnamed protein product, partial [Polarella glacialis]